jgi:hypothetical protein
LLKSADWEQQDIDNLIVSLSGAGIKRLSLDGDYFEDLKLETSFALRAACEAVSASRRDRNLSGVNGADVFNKIKRLQRKHGCQELGFNELHDGAMDRYMEAEGDAAVIAAAGETDKNKIKRLSWEIRTLETANNKHKKRLRNWSDAIGGSDEDEAREAKRQMRSYVGKFCTNDVLLPDAADRITVDLAKEILQVADSLGDPSRADEIRHAIAGIVGVHKGKGMDAQQPQLGPQEGDQEYAAMCEQNREFIETCIKYKSG